MKRRYSVVSLNILESKYDKKIQACEKTLFSEVQQKFDGT